MRHVWALSSSMALIAVFILDCSQPPSVADARVEEEAEPADEAVEAVEERAPTPQEVPIAEDFDDEAERDIDETNYEQVLRDIEAELSRSGRSPR